MLVHLDEFKVVGLNVRTINSAEFNPKTAKLPQLWGQFVSEGIADTVPNRLEKDSIFGVYSDYDSDATGFYSVTAGVMVNPEVSVPNLKIINVQAGDYLVFKGRGKMPQTVVDTWKKVWDYFAENTEYKRSYTTDFEQYQGMDCISIHIGVLTTSAP
jgi:predicted transcriptional regulator YdeE